MSRKVEQYDFSVTDARRTVVCDIASYAVPCKQNAPWFDDRRFDRIHHRHGAVSRVYATVIEPGTITIGDDAVLEP
jgi:MOSC domain-containing protein YiiM